MSREAHGALQRILHDYMFSTKREHVATIYGVPLDSLTREEALAVIRWVWDCPGVINPTGAAVPNLKGSAP